jgi:hypothetical protein
MPHVTYDIWNRRKCHGEMNAQPAGLQRTANSVTVANGTITSGDVTSTRTIDQTYLTVQETGKFQIDFTFTGIVSQPARCKVVGRYEGNPAHAVFLYIYNYNTTSWDRVTAAADDFPSGSTDGDYLFDLPLDSDYYDSGECQLRIEHDSSAVSSHYMYVDYIVVLQAALLFPTGGSYVQAAGFNTGESYKTLVDGSAGTITIQRAGTYEVHMDASGTGTSMVGYMCALFINGVYEAELWRLYLTDSVASDSSGSWTGKLVGGDVLSIRIACELGDAYAAIFTASVRAQEL